MVYNIEGEVSDHLLTMSTLDHTILSEKEMKELMFKWSNTDWGALGDSEGLVDLYRYNHTLNEKYPGPALIGGPDLLTVFEELLYSDQLPSAQKQIAAFIEKKQCDSAAEAAQNSKTALPEGFKACSFCTFANLCSRSHCQMCEQPLQ